MRSPVQGWPDGRGQHSTQPRQMWPGSHSDLLSQVTSLTSMPTGSSTTYVTRVTLGRACFRLTTLKPATRVLLARQNHSEAAGRRLRDAQLEAPGYGKAARKTPQWEAASGEWRETTRILRIGQEFREYAGGVVANLGSHEGP